MNDIAINNESQVIRKFDERGNLVSISFLAESGELPLSIGELARWFLEKEQEQKEKQGIAPELL